MKGQAATDGVYGQADYFVTLSSERLDGFHERQPWLYTNSPSMIKVIHRRNRA